MTQPAVENETLDHPRAEARATYPQGRVLVEASGISSRVNGGGLRPRRLGVSAPKGVLIRPPLRQHLDKEHE
jgi:hypothetical protein